MDKVQPYRQPMVTATGIFLGFMLNFTSEWTRQTFSIQRLRDVAVAIGIVTSLALLLLTLFRILSMSYPANPYKFYRKTLLFFLIGIFIPFVAFIIVIVEKFILNFSDKAS
jgi:hypothetical protein